jgi:hypothetical protein
MKLGIGLPNTMAHETDRGLMLDWARGGRFRAGNGRLDCESAVGSVWGSSEADADALRL